MSRGRGAGSWPVSKETRMAEFQYAPESASLFRLQTQGQNLLGFDGYISHVLLMSSLTNKFSRRISGEITVLFP